MEISVTGSIPVKGDCGHEFEIPIGGFEDEFTCPVCGAQDRFSEEQVAKLRAQITEQAAAFGVEKIRESFDKSMRKAFKGSKPIKYRSK